MRRFRESGHCTIEGSKERGRFLIFAVTAKCDMGVVRAHDFEVIDHVVQDDGTCCIADLAEEWNARA